MCSLEKYICQFMSLMCYTPSSSISVESEIVYNPDAILDKYDIRRFDDVFC